MLLWNGEVPRAGIELAGATAAVDTLAWSPDGSWLAAASRDNTVGVWNASGAMAQAFRVNGIGSPDLAWSPDGTRVAIGDDRNVSIFEARSGSRLQRWLAHDGDYEVVIVGWSPDGRTLATRGRADDAVKMWNVASGRLLATAEVGLVRGLLDRFF